jgi:transcriptional regulator with XRE-family HTH domain
MNRTLTLESLLGIPTPDGVISNVVKREKQYRKAKNITQKELARLSNVTYASVRRFEEKGEISFVSLVNIGFALDCLEDFSSLFSKKPYSSIEEIIDDQSNGE